MAEPPAFEISITTVATRSILRAVTERGLAAKAEFFIRRVHARGELIGFSVVGSDRAAIGRIICYLNEVMAEVERMIV